MKVNLSKIVGDNENLLGHMILQGMSKACMDALKREESSKEITADVVLTVNGHEVDIQKFCRTWQDQVGYIVKKEAKEQITDKVVGSFCNVQELMNDLERRLKEEIDKKLEDWEKEIYEERAETNG